MHCFQLGETVFGRYILIYLPGDRVEGSLNRFAKFEFSQIRTAGVFGTILDFLVHHIGSGVILLLKSRRVDHQRFDRTAGLSVALECAVEGQSRLCLLRSSADHCNDLSRAVVNAHGRSLHLVLSVIRRFFKICEFLVYTVLQYLLFFQVKSCVHFIAALKQFGKA